MAKLTLKQEKAVIHYIEHGNKTEAYKHAYSTEKMKPETINRKAVELFDNGKMTARVEELMQPILDKLQVTKEKTLKRLMQGQEFDIRNLYDKDGKLKKPTELDDNTAKGIVGIKLDSEGNVIEYKVMDVKGCCELVGKHLYLFPNKNEHSGPNNGPIETCNLTKDEWKQILREVEEEEDY